MPTAHQWGIMTELVGNMRVDGVTSVSMAGPHGRATICAEAGEIIVIVNGADVYKSTDVKAMIALAKCVTSKNKPINAGME